MGLNISYARETKKVKSGVRYYMSSYKNDQDSIITVKAWQLVCHIDCSNLFFVTKKCSKNNALLSMPHARSLTKLVSTNKNSEELSNFCKTLVKNLGEACERNVFN